MSKILFDQGTPVAIRHVLARHEVHTARECGWDTLTNGELLKEAEAGGFEVLLTTDQNLVHQQNLIGRRIAIVVLGGNRWSRVRLVLDSIAEAVDAAEPGSLSLVEVPR